MTGELSKNFHGVGIGPLSNILAVKSHAHSLALVSKSFGSSLVSRLESWNFQLLASELIPSTRNPSNIWIESLDDSHGLWTQNEAFFQ